MERCIFFRQHMQCINYITLTKHRLPQGCNSSSFWIIPLHWVSIWIFTVSAFRVAFQQRSVSCLRWIPFVSMVNVNCKQEKISLNQEFASSQKGCCMCVYILYSSSGIPVCHSESGPFSNTYGHSNTHLVWVVHTHKINTLKMTSEYALRPASWFWDVGYIYHTFLLVFSPHFLLVIILNSF